MIINQPSSNINPKKRKESIKISNFFAPAAKKRKLSLSQPLSLSQALPIYNFDDINNELTMDIDIEINELHEEHNTILLKLMVNQLNHYYNIQKNVKQK